MSDKRLCVVLKADGNHEEVEYEYSEDWQDQILGGKMLELGDIPVLSVHLAVVDPDGAPKTLKENKYQLSTPEPEPLESLRKQGRLRGDIIVFNGDGDFTLDTWVQYQENPEDFEDNGEDYQDEDDDEGGEDDEGEESEEEQEEQDDESESDGQEDDVQEIDDEIDDDDGDNDDGGEEDGAPPSKKSKSS